MLRTKYLSLIIILAAITMIIGCTPQKSDSSLASKAVMTYLDAIVSQNSDRLSNVSCKSWEDQALLDMDSFIGVSAKLDNVTCNETGREGDSTVVSCNGNILATYNNEQQKIDLSTHAYTVVNEGGEWRVCGYKK
jgi:hypothetical protein